jgi:Uma2 family endonuclease
LSKHRLKRENEMATALEPPIWTATELAERFGPIPLSRIATRPAPGHATEADVVELNDREDRLFELVDGVLVEKTMGAPESMLAIEIAALLFHFVKPRKLGVVLGADGLLKLGPGLIRIPDVAFLSKKKSPKGRVPKASAWSLAPDLAVEVLSKGNTAKEMIEKLHDYFTAGSRLVWYVDPQKRQVVVYTSPTAKRAVKEGQILDGGEVLAGLEINLRELFAELPPG